MVMTKERDDETIYETSGGPRFETEEVLSESTNRDEAVKFGTNSQRIENVLAAAEIAASRRFLSEGYTEAEKQDAGRVLEIVEEQRSLLASQLGQEQISSSSLEDRLLSARMRAEGKAVDQDGVIKRGSPDR